jgi:hypothetical protein
MSDQFDTNVVHSDEPPPPGNYKANSLFLSINYVNSTVKWTHLFCITANYILGEEPVNLAEAKGPEIIELNDASDIESVR